MHQRTHFRFPVEKMNYHSGFFAPFWIFPYQNPLCFGYPLFLLYDISVNWVPSWNNWDTKDFSIIQ